VPVEYGSTEKAEGSIPPDHLGERAAGKKQLTGRIPLAVGTGQRQVGQPGFLARLQPGGGDEAEDSLSDLPGFVLVAMSRPLLARVRQSRPASAFLDGVNVASLSLMAVVTVQIGRAALVDLTTVALAAVSALLLLRLKVSSGWVIAAGAAVGAAVRHFGG